MSPLARTRSLAILALGAAVCSFSSCDKKAASTSSSESAAPSTPALSGVSPAAVAQQVELKKTNNAAFEAVTNKLDSGGTFLMYLGTSQWLEGLSAKIAPIRDMILSLASDSSPAERAQMSKVADMVLDVIKKSGLEEITAIGTSSAIPEPGVYQNKTFIHRKAPGQGLLWTLFGRKPHKLDGLALLPGNTAYASAGDLDIAELIKLIRSQIHLLGDPQVEGQFEAFMKGSPEMGNIPVEDFLNSLAGSVGMVLTLDPSKTVEIEVPDQKMVVPAPRFALYFTVKDDRIFKKADEMIPKDPNAVESVSEPGLEMRTFKVPPVPNSTMTVTPTVASSKAMLILSSDKELVREILDGGKTPRLSGSPEFLAYAKGLPTDGNGFTVVTKLFMDTFMKLERQMIMKNAAQMPPGMLQFMDKILAAAPGGGYQVWTQLEDGWLIWGRTAVAGAQAMAHTLLLPVAIATGVVGERSAQAQKVATVDAR